MSSRGFRPDGAPVASREDVNLSSAEVAAAGRRVWRVSLALPAYWPAMLGTGLASLFVVASLTLAVQTMKRPPATPLVPAESASDKGPAIDKSGPPPKAEAVIPVATVKALNPASLANAGSPASQITEAKPPPQSALDSEPEPVIALDEPAAEVAIEAQACDTCGTSIKFMRSPQAAARRAAREEKLVLLLHVSGNFEDAGFT
jgi:hypothetical protein